MHGGLHCISSSVSESRQVSGWQLHSWRIIFWDHSALLGTDKQQVGSIYCFVALSCVLGSIEWDSNADVPFSFWVWVQTKVIFLLACCSFNRFQQYNHVSQISLFQEIRNVKFSDLSNFPAKNSQIWLQKPSEGTWPLGNHFVKFCAGCGMTTVWTEAPKTVVYWHNYEWPSCTWLKIWGKVKWYNLWLWAHLSALAHLPFWSILAVEQWLDNDVVVNDTTIQRLCHAGNNWTTGLVRQTDFWWNCHTTWVTLFPEITTKDIWGNCQQSINISLPHMQRPQWQRLLVSSQHISTLPPRLVVETCW